LTLISCTLFLLASYHQLGAVKQNPAESGKSGIRHVSCTSCVPILVSRQPASSWIF